MKSGYDLWQEKKHKQRFKDGGIVCNGCKLIKYETPRKKF